MYSQMPISSACSPHVRVSHLSTPAVKGHIKLSQVNQAANNKLTIFDKQMFGHLLSSTGGIQLTRVTVHHQESCVVFLRDCTSYSCQAKVGEFLDHVEERFLRFHKKIPPLFVQFLCSCIAISPVCNVLPKWRDCDYVISRILLFRHEQRVVVFFLKEFLWISLEIWWIDFMPKLRLQMNVLFHS